MGMEVTRVTDEQVAESLEQIAQILQIEGADVFRRRSYERAAEAVRGLGRSLVEIRETEPKGLQSIPGIGEAISKKIEEMLDTGELAYLNEMLEHYPPGFLELLRIPGLGPSRAGLLYHELGIGSVDELEEACVRGQVRELKGMGEKTEQKLLQSIERYWRGMERALLGEVLPRAEALVEMVRALPAVERADFAGSVRRAKETVGDLDLLATARDQAAVCRAFAESGALSAVELSGDTKVSGRLHGGRQMDLRVVEPESYGAALVYFTGSQQHNIRLRERGQSLKLKVNEYGVFRGGKDGPEGERVAGETEESVYAALGLAWIPPELREDRGEIQAAATGELPDLIDIGDIRADLHMHTTASDGRASIAEYAEAAMKRGFTHIGITDHSPALVIARGIGADSLRRQRDEIDALNARYEAEGRDFRVLLGSEADILMDGAVDASAEALEVVDYVIGAIHQGFSQDGERITGRITQALESGVIDILAHPTGRLLLRRDPYAVDISAVIDVAAKHDVALEINASYDRLDLSDVHSRLARERGALLAINTDSHSLGEFDLLRYGVLTARRGWVEAEGVINTWPLPRLQEWLAKRRG